MDDALVICEASQTVFMVLATVLMAQLFVKVHRLEKDLRARVRTMERLAGEHEEIRGLFHGKAQDDLRNFNNQE